MLFFSSLYLIICFQLYVMLYFYSSSKEDVSVSIVLTLADQRVSYLKEFSTHPPRPMRAFAFPQHYVLPLFYLCQKQKGKTQREKGRYRKKEGKLDFWIFSHNCSYAFSFQITSRRTLRSHLLNSTGFNVC